MTLIRMLVTRIERKASRPIGAFFVVSVFWFFFSFSNAYASTSPNCSSSAPVVRAELKRVHDGDSIALTDGTKVRFIGVNAPELEDKGRGLPEEPYAQAAKQAVIDFFSGSRELGLQVGRDGKDRYGRTLAHVYRLDGQSLEAFLVAQGLAVQVTIAPNVEHWECLKKIESVARKQKVGLWADPYYASRSIKSLKSGDAGYRRVIAKVQQINIEKASSWWIEFEGPLAVRIPQSGQQYFDHKQLGRYVGKTIEVSGWLIDRKGDPKVEKRGYSRWMLNVSHPNALKPL